LHPGLRLLSYRRRRSFDQLVEGRVGLISAAANGGGVAFFAHVGGFAFGALVTDSAQHRASRPAKRGATARTRPLRMPSDLPVRVILAVLFTSAVATLIDVLVLGHEPPTEQSRRLLRLRRAG
jgi:hypothetical protein